MAGSTVTVPLKVVVSSSSDMYIYVSSVDFGTTAAFYLGSTFTASMANTQERPDRALFVCGVTV
jgi:hypothetical protein